MLEPGVRPVSLHLNVVCFYKVLRSQSVHGRTNACHALRRGSLPLGTAIYKHIGSAVVLSYGAKRVSVFLYEYPVSSKVEHSADNRETEDRYLYRVPSLG